MPSLPFRIDMAMVLAPTRTRRIIMGLAFVAFLFLYFRSLSFRAEPTIKPGSGQIANFPSCLNGYRAEIERSVAEMEAVANVGSKLPKELFMVGNGRVASTPLTGAHLYLGDDGHPLDLGHDVHLKYKLGDTPFSLVLSVLNMKLGQVELYYVGEGCVTIREVVFASLDQQSLIVHDIFINNPTITKHNIEIKSSIGSHLESTQKITVNGKPGVVYSDVVTSGQEAHVAAAASYLTHKSVEVEPGRTRSAQLFISLASRRLADIGERSEMLKYVSKIVSDDLSKIREEQAARDHREHWREIRRSGVRVVPLQDHLLAKPFAVNSTLYYLLSMYNPSSTTTATSSQECFRGSPSSHSPVLWTPVKSLESAALRLNAWKTELQTGGCEKFASTSRLAFFQSLLRSFSAVRETVHGIELAINPHSVEGTITLRGLEYEEVLVDISLSINTPDHRGTVSVSKSSEFKDTILYTCDQICSGEPRTIPMNGDPLVYQIRPTNPSTPILYVAKDQQQLVDLRHLIEEHHGLDLHTLEEHPISALFIVLISVVIILFHVLLFHMIYKEYCTQPATRTAL